VWPSANVIDRKRASLGKPKQASERDILAAERMERYGSINADAFLFTVHTPDMSAYKDVIAKARAAITAGSWPRSDIRSRIFPQRQPRGGTTAERATHELVSRNSWREQMRRFDLTASTSVAGPNLAHFPRFPSRVVSSGQKPAIAETRRARPQSWLMVSLVLASMTTPDEPLGGSTLVPTTYGFNGARGTRVLGLSHWPSSDPTRWPVCFMIVALPLGSPTGDQRKDSQPYQPHTS
jgi:hypothetical protein